jgi:hypothetical protein
MCVFDTTFFFRILPGFPEGFWISVLVACWCISCRLLRLNTYVVCVYKAEVVGGGFEDLGCDVFGTNEDGRSGIFLLDYVGIDE